MARKTHHFRLYCPQKRLCIDIKLLPQGKFCYVTFNHNNNRFITMTPEDIAAISNQAIMTLLRVIMPLMIVALGAGLLIALFQALTSIQEMTLTFVPKIVLVFLLLLFIMPWMASQMNLLAIQLFDQIVAVGGG